jgi:L-aminopeptidase/D-esterase-like protein
MHTATVVANGITAVGGVEVGHYTDLRSATGCTVVLCRGGAVGGVDVRGSAPGTRETDLLRPTSLVTEVQGVLLSGGSAFGLDAASGVVRYLEERGVGLRSGGAIVPIVPAAVLFDLSLVTGTVRPGPEDGYAACRDASTGPIEMGSVGAGTGAVVAKLRGMRRAVKGGVGTASVDLGEGLVVGAIVAVNAVGDVVDADTGESVAAARGDDGGSVSAMDILTGAGSAPRSGILPGNTTIGVVATNARLSKEQANKLASVAHDGLALAVRPAHTMVDGDTMFALGTGLHDGEADMVRLCAAATLTVSRAIVEGVRQARGLGGIPGVGDV